MTKLSTGSNLERLIARILALQPDDQRRWGALTPHAALCHIADSNELALGLCSAGEAKQGFMSSAFGQWLVIDSPFPWPKGKVKAPPAFFVSQPGDFDRDRSRAINSLRQVAAFTGPWPASVIFGALNQRQWHKLTWRHINHHLCQFGRF